MSEIIVNQNKYHYIASIKDHDQPVYVFLHGFLGSKNDFQKLLNDFPKQYLALDLLGFGENRFEEVPAEKFVQSSQIGDLEQIFQRLNLTKIILVGYSMGGRIAIAYALKYPKRLVKLVLESTTAGIDDAEKRLARQSHDQLLAEKLRRSGMEEFVANWEKMPLFASQKAVTPEKFTFMHQQRLEQNPQNAANSLLMMGTGKQPNYWDDIKCLADLSVSIVVGSEDGKFVKIGQKMQQRISDSILKIVPNVGHNIHFEEPKIFKNILLNIE
ncbi:2-succinyl-6-hydroxy-2,4-cyclohexadiene-1-carboxylate synthase [Companilactobacillus zhongbaensis]|uniref:2-succinyl-6-hydroxy-2, 4-cyclohexadiene-1-carboxylate synthase n=1 Tax=Companilactobacillus zhongbaensis TaxID=2486009 RepID=UPI0013DE259F|nr:2-succinyl-6-hydroxy-2,4-cyclohexadiene-1-carboxylate synthase [Companilactobacillus zhongbaensis]